MPPPHPDDEQRFNHEQPYHDDALPDNYFEDMLLNMETSRSAPALDGALNGALNGALDGALDISQGNTPDSAATPQSYGETGFKRQRLDSPSVSSGTPIGTPSAGAPPPNATPAVQGPAPAPGAHNAHSAPPAPAPSSAGTPSSNTPPGGQSKAAAAAAGSGGSSGSANGGSAPLEIKKMTDVKSRACDECRRRKTACYYLKSESAKCFRCQMENIECTFNSPTRSVGSSGGASGGGRNVPIPPRLGAKQPVVAGLVGPVEDYSQLPGRSLLKKTLSLQHPRSSFAIGQHGLWDQRVLQSIQLDKSNQARVSQNLTLRKVGPDSWFMIRNEAGHNDWVRECDIIERTVYPYGRALVNSFFMFFHREFPILHEKIFIEKYLRTYRELMPALLGAVYLLGMRWWNHNSELSTVSKPDSILPALYDVTLTSFFKSSGCSSLSLIQAGLLLLHCSFSDPRHLSICSVINAAAFRLALNRNCLHWKLPRWEINLRIRLSWATYTQCTWICLLDSIPPLIHDESWFLSPFSSDIFDSGANEPLHNGALFIQMNKLSLIVHDMHNMLSSRLLLMYSSEISATQTIINNANVNVDLMDPFKAGPWYRKGSGAGVAGGPNGSSSNSSADVGAGSGNGSAMPSQSIDAHPGAGSVGAAGSGSTGGSSSSGSTGITGGGGGAGISSGSGGSSSNVSGSASLQQRSAEDIIELIKPIQLRLHDWYANVPAALLNLEGENPTGNFSLRVAYISAEVILHRFIIRVSCSDSARLDPDMIRLLRSTARERLDVAYRLIKQLKPQHLQQFWYFSSSFQFAVIGVFAALMYTTSESTSESEYYWVLLRDYINQLQLYSDNDVMGAALRTLRSSIAGVPGLVF